MNEWDKWIIYGGPMPTLDLPHVSMPETVIIEGDTATIIKPKTRKIRAVKGDSYEIWNEGI